MDIIWKIMLDHPWNTTIHRTISARWTTIGPKEERSRLIIARNRIGSRMTHVGWLQQRNALGSSSQITHRDIDEDICKGQHYESPAADLNLTRERIIYSDRERVECRPFLPINQPTSFNMLKIVAGTEL